MTTHIQWRKGYRSKTNAVKVHSELEKIRKRDGGISPGAVIERAKAKNNAMHKEFEWDDTVAGEKFRLTQARTMIGAVQVIYTEAPERPAKAFTLTTKVAEPLDDEPPQRVYQDTREALSDPVMRDEVLGNAIREALAFRRKYAELQELAQVFAALDDFLVHAKV